MVILWKISDWKAIHGIETDGILTFDVHIRENWDFCWLFLLWGVGAGLEMLCQLNGADPTSPNLYKFWWVSTEIAVVNALHVKINSVSQAIVQ